jgi:WD40 repeat protein
MPLDSTESSDRSPNDCETKSESNPGVRLVVFAVAGILIAALTVTFIGCRRPISLSAVSAPSSGATPVVRADSKKSTATDGDSATEPAYALVVSKDGGVLATTGKDGKLKLLFPATGQDLPSPEKLNEGLLGALALSPDAKLLAWAQGKRILLYSCAENRLVDSFTGHDHNVLALAFTPDGQGLISGGFDGFLKLWKVPQCKLTRTLANLYSAANAVAVTPDGALAISGSGFLHGDLKLWPLPTGEPSRNLSGHERSVTTLAVSDDGTLLASAGGGALRLWSLPQGQPLKTIATGTGCTSLAFVPGGKFLACASNDKVIRLWSVPDGKAQNPLTGHRGKVQALAVAPGNDQALYSADDEGNLLVWDLKTCQSKPLATTKP